MYTYESGLTAEQVYNWLFTNSNYASTKWGHGIGSQDYCKGYNSLLDIGCGKSEFAISCRDEFGIERVAVCDIAGAAVEFQRGMGLDSTRIDLGTRLPYDDDSYDVVTCWDVLEHLRAEDVPRALSEILRIASKRVLCTIAHKFARARGPNGEPLHLTVEPESWWLMQFAKLDVTPVIHDVLRLVLPDGREIYGKLWDIQL